MERRKLLTSTFIGTATLAVGINIWQPWTLPKLALSEDNQSLLRVLLPVILDGALPAMPVDKTRAIERTIEAINKTITSLPTSHKEEIQILFESLNNRLGLLLLTGSITPLLLRQPQQLIKLLDSWRDSFVEMQKYAYLGLRDLIITSFYSCPEHWLFLNYQKPQLNSGTVAK